MGSNDNKHMIEQLNLIRYNDQHISQQSKRHILAAKIEKQLHTFQSDRLINIFANSIKYQQLATNLLFNSKNTLNYNILDDIYKPTSHEVDYMCNSIVNKTQYPKESMVECVDSEDNVVIFGTKDGFLELYSLV